MLDWGGTLVIAGLVIASAGLICLLLGVALQRLSALRSDILMLRAAEAVDAAPSGRAVDGLERKPVLSEAAREPLAFQAALAKPVLSACLACASALLLNPIAWKQRSWWLWYPADPSAPATAPLTALITLSVFSLGATAVMRRGNEPNESPRGMSGPLWIFVVMNATALAALIVRTAI
jgi:hypothetical protein